MAAPALSAAVVSILGADPAVAQQPTVSAGASPPAVQRVVGTLVDDESLTPVTGAAVTALRVDGPDDEAEGVPAGRARTDGAGGFVIELDRPGHYRLRAEALGYALTTSRPVEVAGAEVTVDFRILPQAILMEPLLVTARRGTGRDLFYRRMDEWGRGVFLTPEAIDSIAPRVHPAEVFRGRDDTWLSWQGTGRFGAPIPALRSLRGEGCLGILVDRVPVVRRPGDTGSIWDNYPLDTLLPQDIEAVEYYRFVGEAPPELRRFARPADPGRSQVQCGLVVFWTRNGW